MTVNSTVFATTITNHRKLEFEVPTVSAHLNFILYFVKIIKFNPWLIMGQLYAHKDCTLRLQTHTVFTLTHSHTQ